MLSFLILVVVANYAVLESSATSGIGAVCYLPKVIGPCNACLPRYYFNSKTGKCTRFNYGGCGGNRNNFPTLKQCKAKCGRCRKLRPMCSLPKVTGSCKAYCPRYYFNSKTGKCTRFIYGGCGGNRNNFPTMKECIAKCGSCRKCGELM